MGAMTTFFRLLATTLVVVTRNNFVWFARLFSTAGLVGLIVTALARRSKAYRLLSTRFEPAVSQ